MPSKSDHHITAKVDGHRSMVTGSLIFSLKEITIYVYKSKKTLVAPKQVSGCKASANPQKNIHSNGVRVQFNMQRTIY